MIPFSGYYSQKEPRVDTFLTSVGPGSPCGEYMRRFWHPVMKTEDLSDLPKLIRHFGDDYQSSERYRFLETELSKLNR